MSQHHNYVACFSDGRIKIGRTRRPAARIRELRADLYELGRPVSPRVALLVETHLRQCLAQHALPGTREWFHAPKSAAAEIVALTARLQDTFQAVA